MAQFRWIGAAPGFSDAFNTFIKSEFVPVRCWDKLSKTWWFPEQYEHNVRDKLVELNLLHPDAARAWVMDFTGLAKDKSSLEPDFSVLERQRALRALGLDPKGEMPPREFIRQAYWFWKNHWTTEGVFNRVTAVEDAWTSLTGEVAP